MRNDWTILFGNGNRKEWELTMWEWEGMWIQKAIPDHLYLEKPAFAFHNFQTGIFTTKFSTLSASYIGDKIFMWNFKNDCLIPALEILSTPSNVPWTIGCESSQAQRHIYDIHPKFLHHFCELLWCSVCAVGRKRSKVCQLFAKSEFEIFHFSFWVFWRRTFIVNTKTFLFQNFWRTLTATICKSNQNQMFL